MKKQIIKLKYFGLFVFLFVFLSPAAAIYDPLEVPNNRYGIHIADVNDLYEASRLVNSSGGDWGYITLVIPETDRNSDKWQEIFNQIRRLRLIPIVRLATTLEGNTWKIPQDKTLDDWCVFLESLNWPVQNRYVVIYNEPNHTLEWGGKIDPEGYAQILVKLANRLKNLNSDYFILPAGLDSSASNTRHSQDSSIYLRRMVKENPAVLQVIDGWTSHSYPNPAFSAPPHGSGKGTIRSFEWEISFLRSLGLDRNIPIFITETGWVHHYGKNFNKAYLSPQTISGYFKFAAQNIWDKPYIAAVTPFIFNYQDVPFDHFSFKKIDTGEYYEHYYAYLEIPKNKGAPVQKQFYDVLSNNLPDNALITNSNYMLTVDIKNKGQNILDPADGYELRLDFKPENFITVSSLEIPVLDSGQSGTLKIFLATGRETETLSFTAGISKKDNYFQLFRKHISISSPISVMISTQLGFKKNVYQPVKASIYNHDENFAFSAKAFLVNQNILVEDIRNIIPGNFYQIEIAVPGYLPVSASFQIHKSGNIFELPRLWPLDFDGDGNWSVNDFRTMLTKPPFGLLNKLF